MADLRRRASRGGRRPWRSTGSRNPFAGGRDPFARTSSPSAAPPPWSHLIAPAAPRRGPTSPRQPRPAAAATLRPRTGICVEEREEPIFASSMASYPFWVCCLGQLLERVSSPSRRHFGFGYGDASAVGDSLIQNPTWTDDPVVSRKLEYYILVELKLDGGV